MTSTQLKVATRFSLAVGVLLFVASIAMSWGKDNSSLSSALFWVGIVMVLFPAIVGARGTKA